MDKQKLIELYNKGYTDTEIAKELNVSRQLIQVNRVKLGLSANFSYKSFRKIDYEKVEILIKKNKTDKEIASLFGVKPISIYFFRKRNNIQRDNLLINKQIELTNRQKSIIIGSLLGDASLRKTNINPIFTCEHGIKQLEYCKWKKEELASLGAKISISKRKNIDIRTGIYYESAICRLPVNPAMLSIYNNLYVNGKKTITKEYLQDFNDISLAVMFMDDGYKIGKTVGIATNCFNIEELKLFVEFLYNKFGLLFTITNRNTLYLLVKYYPLFKEIVLPYIHNKMMYKVSRNHVNLGKSVSR